MHSGREPIFLRTCRNEVKLRCSHKAGCEAQHGGHDSKTGRRPIPGRSFRRILRGDASIFSSQKSVSHRVASSVVGAGADALFEHIVNGKALIFDISRFERTHGAGDCRDRSGKGEHDEPAHASVAMRCGYNLVRMIGEKR